MFILSSLSRRALVCAVAACSASTQNAFAQSTAPKPESPTQLERVIINASAFPDHGDLDALAPIGVLRGDDLRLRESTSLGATLAREPGVQSSAYGAGAGRPIIRGMDSARVRVTESGLGVADVSGASPDHRVSADTFNSRQVEVLRGPSTLLYGSGAIGGLVNIVSDRIPRSLPEAAGANVQLRGTSAERERTAAFDVDAPAGKNLGLRFEGFKQRTDDYRLAAPLRDENGDVIAQRRLPNSDTNTQSLAGGLAWFGAGARVGAAVQRYESDYGIPNPEEPVSISLRRSRAELHADRARAIGPFSGLRSKFAFSHYEHTEFEPNGAAGATFKNRGGEGRVELPHGDPANWRGVLGAQVSDGTTRGSGEGFLPRTGHRALALFVVEQRAFGPLRLELGTRGEQVRFDVEQDNPDDLGGGRKSSRRFSLLTGSTAAAWALPGDMELGATLTLSQRAPAVEELYFEGAHAATFAFEIGDPNLRRECSTQVEVSLRRTAGALRGRVNLFANRFKDYIYGQFDGSTTDILDEQGNVEETLSNLRYRQADARFRGAEAELRYGLDIGLQARVWADTVRATLASGPDSGGNLPRLSPSRIGADVGWRTGDWSATLGLLRVQAQNRVAAFDLRDGVAESRTPGYTTVDASAAYRLRFGSTVLTLLVFGRNLTNEDIRVHTSFLKNLAPPPGRSIGVSLRATI